MSRPLLARGLVRVGAGIGDGDIVVVVVVVVVVVDDDIDDVICEGWDGDGDGFLERKGWLVRVRRWRNI